MPGHTSGMPARRPQPSNRLLPMSTALVHWAVERKFEVIGEALGQLAKLEPTLAARIPNLRQIVAFRNQLIHGYAAVNHSTVWHVVQDALPELLACVRALLLELGED